MNGRIIGASDCTPQRWKNGLGTTREIAVQPSDESDADFLWRVSIAEVDSAAPFSQFPGIDRHIALLDGAGFEMVLDGSHRHALTTPFAPFAFPGEASVAVTLHGGATRDFNLMVQRQLAGGDIRCVRGAGSFPIDASSVLVFAASGCLHVDGARADTGDSWRRHSVDAALVTVTLDEGAVALIVNVCLRDQGLQAEVTALQGVA